MDSVVSVLSWIWYNFFDRAAMFMMVLVFIGQLLTKRPFLESLMGALKAYIGYIVYQTATGGPVHHLPAHHDGPAPGAGHEHHRQR